MDHKNQKPFIIASIAFGGLCFILMIAVFVYESIRIKNTKLAPVQVQLLTTDHDQGKGDDYSEYHVMIGDDGREMVRVPDGFFQMGSNEGDYDEAPQHPVYLSSFYIDRYEVTNAVYAQFLKASGNPRPFVPVFEDDISKILNPDQAAVGMSWSDAAAYCRWAGKRLPTEAEWEKAARGEQSRIWPWGNSFGTNNANIQGDSDSHPYTAPPGKYEGGRSPYGGYDMAGNASEWVADWYDPQWYASSPLQDPKGPETGKHRVVRGGSWAETPVNVRTTKRFAAAPWRTDSTIGLRCAMDTPTSLSTHPSQSQNS